MIAREEHLAYFVEASALTKVW